MQHQNKTNGRVDHTSASPAWPSHLPPPFLFSEWVATVAHMRMQVNPWPAEAIYGQCRPQAVQVHVFCTLRSTDIQHGYESFQFSHGQVPRVVTTVPMCLSHSAVPDVLQHAIIKHTQKGRERIFDVALCVRCGAGRLSQDILALSSPWPFSWLKDRPHRPILPFFHNRLQLR